MRRVAHVNHSSSLAQVVRGELAEAGHLTPAGLLTRDAERRTGLDRNTIGRVLASGAITAQQLGARAELLDVRPSDLMARAESAA